MNCALTRFLYLNWAKAVDGSGLGLPLCLTEAQLLKQPLSQLKKDIVLAKGALSLPLPLSKVFSQLSMRLLAKYWEAVRPALLPNPVSELRRLVHM